jgi:hypothetical protein
MRYCSASDNSLCCWFLLLQAMAAPMRSSSSSSVTATTTTAAAQQQQQQQSCQQHLEHYLAQHFTALVPQLRQHLRTPITAPVTPHLKVNFKLKLDELALRQQLQRAELSRIERQSDLPSLLQRDYTAVLTGRSRPMHSSLQLEGDGYSDSYEAVAPGGSYSDDGHTRPQQLPEVRCCRRSASCVLVRYSRTVLYIYHRIDRLLVELCMHS